MPIDQGCRAILAIGKVRRVMAPLLEKLRFGLYGLAIGLFIGLILGWLFHGFVGALVKIGIVAILLVPLGLAIWFWFKISKRNTDDGSAVQEARWHEGPPPS
jgi:hypothetical protein